MTVGPINPIECGNGEAVHGVYPIQQEDLPLPPLLLKHAKALLEKKRRMEKECALMLFEPHPGQLRFFNAGYFQFRYARTGNRWGKSECGSGEDVSHALGYRPWIPPGVTFRTLGMTEDPNFDCPKEYWDVPLRTLGISPNPTTGMIVCVTWKKSREIFTEEEAGALGKLWKYIPKKDYIDHSRNHSGFIDRIVVRHISGGRSVIRLDTVEGFKNNALSQESSSFDWVHIDEPIPEPMWKAIVRGLVDRKGKAWFTCTPLSEPWIDQAFVPELEDQSKENLGVISDLSTSRWMTTGTMDDNPYNTEEAIRLASTWWTDDEKEARRKGIPIAYAGIIYKEFNWNTHVRKEPPVGWESWDKPPANHCIYIATDYHFRKNNATLFIAVPPDGPAIVFAELWKQMLIDEEVAEIRRILAGRPYQPIIMDPLASTPNKVTDLTAMDEYRMRGLAVLPATKDPVNGIRAVKALFKARGKDGKTPCIIVSSALSRFLSEVSRGFIWDGEENKPVKKDDDMMECLYRLVLQGLIYVEPALDHEYSPLPPRDIPSNVLRFDFGEDWDAKRAAADRATSRANRYRPGTERTITHYEDEAVL